MAGAVLVGLLLRVPGWRDPLGNDEAGSALVGHAWLSGSGGLPSAGPYGSYWFDRPPLLPLAYGAADVLGGADGVRALGALAAAILVLLAAAIGSRVAGARGAVVAGVSAACISSAPVLLGDHTYGELLASVPSAAAVLALLVALRRREATAGGRGIRTLLLASGVLAACAVLVKQSALDAGVAGLAALAASIWAARGAPERGLRLRDAGTWLAGAIAPVAVVAGWAALQPGRLAQLAEAVVGYRLQLIGEATQGSATEGMGEMQQLVLPLVASGLVLLLPLALVGIARGSRGWMRALLLGWLVGAVFGVLGGGFYWPHYLLQLGPPCAVGAAIALRSSGARTRGGILGVLLLAALVGPATRGWMPHSGEFDDDAQRVGQFVARSAEPGDQLEVVWARPGVAYYAGVPMRGAYLWSAMQTTRPGIRAALLDAVEGPRAPTWIVRWNRPDAFHLDDDGRVDAAIDAHYREVARVCGRSVLVRRDLTRDVADPQQRRACG
ncbi:MAG: hypothetical protein JWM98_1412 [Thermoleophilia bacterium]|nr:hypothetical protein [Thermoleophilia bacterium]